MALTLFHKAYDTRALKLRIAAKYVGLELGQKMAEEDLTALAERNTLGKLPALETTQGLLFQTNAILRYIGRQGKGHGLYGNNIFETSLIDGWIDWAAELDLPAAAWLFQVWGLTDANDVETRNMAARDVRDSLAALNRALVSRAYLVGEQVTLADVAVATSVVDLYKLVLDDRFRQKFANVARWLDTVLHQPQFTDILGAVVTYCQSTPGSPLPADVLGEEAAVTAEPPKEHVEAPKVEAAANAASEGTPPTVVTEGPPAETSPGVASPPPGEHKRVASASSLSAADEQHSHSEGGSETSGVAAQKGRTSQTGIRSVSSSALPSSSSSSLPVATSSEGDAEVQHGVSLRPFGTAIKADLELKAGGPDGQGGVLGIFNKKSKEVWVTVNEIKGKLSDDNLVGLQSLLKAEKSSMNKKKTSAFFLFQDQARGDALLSQKTLVVYIQPPQ
jgi:glutathione S-transferase